MSNLWDLSAHRSRRTRRRRAGRHHARDVLERRGEARPARSGCARRNSASGAPGPGTQTGEAVREIGGGLLSLGFAPGETRLHPVQHRRRMGAGRPGRAQLRRRVQRHLPHRRGRAGAVPVRGLGHRASCSSRTTSSSTRRWKCASSCRGCARSSCSTWKACASCDDPSVISLDALRELGRDYLAAHPGELDAARARPASPKTWRSWSTPRAPPASPRARCTATRGLVYTVRGYNTLIAQDEHDERMCFLPLCHIAERMGGEYFVALHRRHAQLRREPRDRARERARDRAHGVHRRAAGVGEVLFRRDDRAQGSQPRCSRRPTPGRIGVGTQIADKVLAGQPVGGCAEAQVHGWRAGWR